MANYKAGSFLATVAKTLTAKCKGTAYEKPLANVIGTFRETIGFPRGATFTVHKRDKMANVSATLESRTDGNGTDLILNPMAGSRPDEALWRFVQALGSAIFPPVKTVANGKTSTDHRRSDIAGFVGVCGIAKPKETGGKIVLTGWDTLPWPEPTYHGSDIPNPKRVFLGFTEAGGDGKRVRYYSLLADGSAPDGAFVAGLYAEGVILKCKSKNAPACYLPPAKPEAKPDETPKTGTEG
jgi:hypothetical protein